MKTLQTEPLMQHPHELIVHLMDHYLAAKNEGFKNHPLHDVCRRIRTSMEGLDAVAARPSLKVRVSVGMGNWASVPWIAVLDARETITTKDGVYIIVLFRADMSGLYVTLNQGITQPLEGLGRTAGRIALRARRDAIRSRFPELSSLGFNVNDRIDLRAARNFAAGYEESTVAHRLFEKAEVEQGDGLVDAVAGALDVYGRYLAAPIALRPSV